MIRTAASTLFLVLLSGATWCSSTCQGLAAERRPWEVLRFVQQSSKFVQFPFLPGSRRASSTQVVRPGATLWTARSRSSTGGVVGTNLPVSFTMAPLDDVVMGGASASTFDDATGTWSGTVTDANNGGFIGIRSTPAFLWDCSKCRGLEWKVKLLLNEADESSSSKRRQSRRFKFVLRDSTEFNGITWTTSVDLAPGSVQTVKIPFNRQVPALFARKVPNQTFRKDNIVSVQVAYSKFEYDGDLNPNFSLGNVKLQLLELRAY